MHEVREGAVSLTRTASVCFVDIYREQGSHGQMLWRPYLFILTIVLFFAGAAVLGLFVSEALAPSVTPWLIGLIGGGFILQSFLTLGIALTVSDETTCPHCRQKSLLTIGVFNSKPVLIKNPRAS